MVRNSKSLILFIVWLTAAVFIYIAVKQDQVCNQHVVLEDGTEYDCRKVNSFTNGTSCILICGGEHVIVARHRIKIVTQLKSE